MTARAHRHPRLHAPGSWSKVLLGWLLGLALVLTQHAAVQHQLEHSLSDPAHQSERAPGQACQLCQLFAQVESLAAGPAIVALALCALVFALVVSVKPLGRSLDLPVLHNRGPPALL